MPRVPAQAMTTAPEIEVNPRIAAQAAMILAATAPEIVPTTLMPPSIPGGTLFQVVTRTVRPGYAVPRSLEAVSAATSARAARERRRAKGSAGGTQPPGRKQRSD